MSNAVLLLPIISNKYIYMHQETALFICAEVPLGKLRNYSLNAVHLGLKLVITAVQPYSYRFAHTPCPNTAWRRFSVSAISSSLHSASISKQKKTNNFMFFAKFLSAQRIHINNKKRSERRKTCALTVVRRRKCWTWQKP